MDELPLVTFVVFSFNQEKYIREAVEAALSQNYGNLEILLTDDASNDSTFSIMSAIAAEYNGSHSIKLNRNDKNLGIGQHLNRIGQLSSGELIVIAAGDDISSPNRTSVIADEWLQSDRQKLLFHSNVLRIDQESNELGLHEHKKLFTLFAAETFLEKEGYVIGASSAFSSRLFSEFGPLKKELVHEDRVFPFRALLKGAVHHFESPLVRYRVGGVSEKYVQNSVLDKLFGEGLIFAKRRAIDYQQCIEDIQYIDGKRGMSKIAQKKEGEFALLAEFGESKGPNVRSIFEAIRKGCSLGFIVRQLIKFSFPSLYEKVSLGLKVS